MINNNECTWPRMQATHTTRGYGLHPRFPSSITVPPWVTWARRTGLGSLSTCQTLLGRSSTWTLCSQVSSLLLGTVRVGEMTSFKFCTTWFTFWIQKTHGCKEFKDPITLPLRWGSLRTRPHLRRSVQEIGAAVSLTFVGRPTLTNSKQPLATGRSGSFWRTNSSRWMFTPTKCTLFSWKTRTSSVKSASSKSLKRVILRIPSLAKPPSATVVRRTLSKEA